MRIKTYSRYWTTTALLSIQTSLENRLAAVFFTLGKCIRFFLFLALIYFIGGEVQQVGGYSVDQLVVVFLVFNLFDLFGQIFFRGIYWFRDQIISGEFDFRLVKPLNPLFQALTRQTDILDLPLLLVVLITLALQPLTLSPSGLFTFVILCFSGCLIITAIHVVVASLGVITTEVDHTIMIYRDISSMARFPIDIYGSFIRALLTFVIPISLAFTLPAQALLGMLTPATATLTLTASILFFFLSLKLWSRSLQHYSSASS